MKLSPVKRWLGVDAVDFVIQLGITFCVAAVLATASVKEEEVAVFGVFAVSLGVLAFRRARAMRRGEMDPPQQVSGSFAADLEQRVSDLEAMQQRMFELEERVDFAERLLSQQRQPERLP